MEEFENLKNYQLRQLLVNVISESRGKDFTFGWLHMAYTGENFHLDDNREFLIDSILRYRKT
jgi:hypothetical protein